MTLKVVCLVALALVAAADRQPPPKASVEVLVLEEGTGAPIPGARLWLSGKDFEPREAITGPNGDGGLHDLPPGSYHLQVSSARHRYVRGADLKLAAGAIQRITFRLPRGGVIAGTVVSGGRSAPGARVSLLQDVAGSAESHPKISRLQDTMTGADGTFEFVGLAEGKYRLAARLDSRGFDDVYYPGVTTIEASESVAVDLGGRRDVLFRFLNVPKVYVSGRVIDDPEPGRRRLVRRRLDEDTGDAISLVIVPMSQDGSFVMSPLERALHGLIYTRHGDGNQVVAADFRTFLLGDTPEEGLELRARRAASMSGTFIFQEGEPPEKDRLLVNPWPVGPDADLRSRVHVSVTSDTGFRIDALFGAYRFSVDPPRGWLPAAILLEDGRNILYKEMELTPGRHHGGVRVVLTNELATIVGTVPAAGVPEFRASLMAVAFPTDSAQWPFHDQTAKAEVTKDGRFEIRDVRPGLEYFVALCEWPCPTTVAENTARSKKAARVNVDRPGTYRVVLQR